MRLHFSRRGIKIGRLSCSAGCLFALALLLYRGCGPVLGLSLLSAALHELGHLAACAWLRIPVEELRLTLVGAVLEVGGRCQSGLEEFLTALAGPFANLLTAAVALRLPLPMEQRYLLIGVSVMLAVFNLLPVIPLDGSRALHGILSTLLPLAYADWWSRRISELIGMGLFVPGVLLAARGNISLLVLTIWLMFSRRECRSAVG